MALDRQGLGTISVQEFVDRLRSELSTSEAEATRLSALLVEVADDGELISYSAFLAACLSAHEAVLKEGDLRSLFLRLDTDNDGLVTFADLSKALGDTVDLEELRSDLNEDGGSCEELTYDDFRLLLLFPARGLHKILGAENASWRVDTVRARIGLTDEGEAVDAARRENMAWRLWWRDGGPASAGLPHATEALVDGELQRTLSKDLPNVGDDLPAAWAVATVEAKGGDISAARRENLCWRKWNMNGAVGEAPPS
jgi:Ca2+-binding EF-hand superfamily protein